MLCNQCYKKIPPGEEIRKPANSGFFRASWEGYGSEVVCRQCAIKDRKRNRWYWMMFFALWVGSIIITLFFIFFIKRD